MINYDQEIYEGAIQGGATPSLAKLLVAQARHETGNYGNKQTKNNNNVFGFKYSRNSQYANQGNISPEGDPYAQYDTLGDAIKDYILRWMNLSSKEGGTRLQEFNKIQDEDTTTYATKLKGYGYYGATIDEYINGLNWALKRMVIVDFYFKNEKKINYAVIGGVLIGITLYIYYIMKRFRKI
jgi:hypothetical protein